MSLCIVNYITGGGWRPEGQARLKESLELVGFDDEILLLDDTSLICPVHKKIPYAFKLYAMKKAFERGHDIVVWVDASFWAIRNLDNLAEMIYDNGLLVQNSGYPVGQWTSDNCLKRMGVDREAAFNIPMFSGGFIGMCIGHSKLISDFFQKFFNYAKEGNCFKGAWRNRNKEVSFNKKVLGHRHDMSVGSILMDLIGLPMLPNNTLFNYYSWYKQYRKERDLSGVYFVCEGGPRKLPLKEINIG